jgi:hypothetical protein
MATQNDQGIRSFSFASAVTANTLISVSGDNAAQAASTGASAIGVLQNDVAASSIGAVKLFFPTQFGIVGTSAIVTAGNTVFAVTSGTIIGTYANASTVTLGVAINSGVAGDIVEYVPKFNQ